MIGALLGGLIAQHAAARPLQNSDLPVELRDQNIAATLAANQTRAVGEKPGWSEVGVASYYRQSKRFRRTASGERFNENAMTAAHHSLPLGTKVKVTNLSNGRSIVVRINDRPADSNPRVIDLARGAADRLGIIHDGTADVELSLAPADAPIEVAEVPDNLDPPIKSRAHTQTGHAAATHGVTSARATAHHAKAAPAKQVHAARPAVHGKPAKAAAPVLPLN